MCGGVPWSKTILMFYKIDLFFPGKQINFLAITFSKIFEEDWQYAYGAIIIKRGSISGFEDGDYFCYFSILLEQYLSKRLSLLYGLLVGLHSQLSFS